MGPACAPELANRGLKDVLIVCCDGLLSQAQHDEVMRVLHTPPTDPDGLPVGFWSLPRLKDYIATEFEVVLASDSSYQVLLHHAGLSFKQPAARDQRRPAEEVVAARVEQIRDLVDHARERGHLVFAGGLL